ncbi:MAG: hypothetical protein H7Z21_12805 [Hymenobacter sp.]|nr:hypothetical protein [Hymenobacter sp.]
MIEIDLIKKHGKKALGMTEHPHAQRTWRSRVGEILLEIGIIVFAITLSIWLHSWQEHRHDQARERQFLLGLQQDLAEDLQEIKADSAALMRQMRGLRYFKNLAAEPLRADSISYYGSTLTNLTWLTPNDSRFQGLKSSGALGIVENEELLNLILTYYERTTTNLTANARTFSEYKRQTIGPYLDLHLEPDRRNLLAVMQRVPMQNYLAHGEGIPVIIGYYHETGQQARKLRRRIAAYLRGE